MPAKKVKEYQELTELEGIGETTAKKLWEHGILTVHDLASSSARELATELGSKVETVEGYISAALKFLSITTDPIKGTEALEREKLKEYCSTGSKTLDKAFLGGIETGSVTELYGEFGSGKTQLAFTASVMAGLPKEQGGLAGSVLYVDTEGTFSAMRVKQIAEARGLDPVAVLDNIWWMKVINSTELEIVVKKFASFVMQNNIKLAVFDSFVSLHRAEFIGRGTLADRQGRLNMLIHKILKVADICNVAVIITNQVLAAPDTFFGDPTKPAGGNIIGHASTYRIYLKRAGKNRKATLIDSPKHAYGDVLFTVTEKGVTDTEEEEE
jgi:DNA repair protein RadA